jgi:hypothetical protein
MPTLSLTEAFPMAEVIKVVEKLFERNRFDFNPADSDSDLSGYDEDSETSGDESDEEDSDEEDHKKSSSTKKHSKKKRHSSQDSSDSDSDTETVTCAPPKNCKTTAKSTPTKDTKKQSSTKHTDQDDVEQLIKQLGKLSLDDPKYGLLYYKAIKLDTTVTKCVPPPAVINRMTTGNNNAHRHLPYSAGPPCTIPPRPMAPIMSQPMESHPPMTSYACGQVGHGICTCSALLDMISKGTLLRDQNGRITFRDGSVVRWELGEIIIEAASKCKTMQSHLFTMSQNKASEYYQSDAEHSNDYKADVLAAEHHPRRIKENRKKIFNGVAVPTCKEKENVNPNPLLDSFNETPTLKTRVTGRPGMGTRANPSYNRETIPTASGSSKKPEEFVSVPMDVQQPRTVDKPMPDVVMKELRPQKQEVKSHMPLRKSQVSLQVGETQGVTTILNMPVTISIGKVLASSWEVSDQLTNLLKCKNSKPAVVHHAVVSSKDTGSLIQIPLRLENQKIFGIIDTSSELNVINRRAL